MKATLFKPIALVLLISIAFNVFSQEDPQTQGALPKLTHHETPEEAALRAGIIRQFVQTDPPQGSITSIAEFDRAVGAVIAYTNGFGIPMSLIREIAKDAILTTLVPNANAENTVRNLYTQNRINLDNCRFMHIPVDSYWTRDYGPMYITYGTNQIGIVDFPYNRIRPADDEAPKLMAQNLGIEWFGMPVVHTGGNYMTDGYGFASSTTIVYTENNGVPTSEIDQRMQLYLGINDHSVLEDPNNTYIDHIDCWGKYLAPDKVLIRSVPQGHDQYDEIEATAAYYVNKTSPFGTPYKVYRVFTPQNQPYTNSFILNDKVFVPIMNSQYDAQALQVYREAMPGYKVFGVLGKSDTPWQSTDALHCRVHEMADLGMLYLKHIPLQGNVAPQSNYNFAAQVRTYGGQQIISDSVLLYYRINPNPVTPFTKINMSNSMGATWSATLTSPEQGSTVEYYVFAADASGRREFLPFIGAADAYKFYVGSEANASVSVNPTSLQLTAMKDTQTNQTLTINSTGQIGLNYNLSISTSVNDTLVYTLPNSPAATAYSSNTLTESGWTTFNVDQTSQVGNVVLRYTWDGDDYYTEGSLWIESPSGTKVMVGSAQLDGNYVKVVPNFTGEPMNGNWKVWIQDSRGDGGHRATNVIVKIVKDNPAGGWLSTSSAQGIIPAGTASDITVTANAQGMAIGTYNAKLTLWSNDHSQSKIEIPVTFNVTINTLANNIEPDDNKIAVNPNPFSNEIRITYTSEKENVLQAELYNANGRLVHRMQEKIVTGVNNMTINTSKLKQGTYLLKILNGNEVSSYKLVKVR